MDSKDQLLELLRSTGWKPGDLGEWVRGPHYVAFLPRGVIHIGQEPPPGSRPDTNRWGKVVTLEQAAAWVLARNAEKE